jgi:hypothetical protein
MRRSSIIILGVCLFLLILLVMIYVPLHNQSKPELTQQDAEKMLRDLGDAFQRESSSAVLSFASPDAKVAGRDLENIRTLLNQAFHAMKDPKVEWENVALNREGPEVHVTAKVTVKDLGDGSAGSVPYSSNMGFKLERRAEPHLFGLVQVYTWKIVDVDAPHLPSGL